MEVKTEWFEKGGKQYGKFSFIQKLTKNDAEKAIIEWQTKFEEHQYEKFTLIWNCTRLTEYEPMARIFWQKKLKETENQIERIWLVSDSKMIRAGASLMRLFVKVDLKVVSSEEGISDLSESLSQNNLVLI